MDKTPQEIVNAAYKYMLEVMQVQASKVSNPRVEELVPVEPATAGGKKTWNVVLSYDIVGDFAFEKTREYKQFSVTAEGVVLDMKIKKV